MFKNSRKKIACFISPEYKEEADEILVKGMFKLREDTEKIEHTINQRVAEALLKVDPFELVLRDFHGVFSHDFEKMEEPLNDQSKLRLSMWAYQQKTDTEANFFSDWIMNTAGNALFKLTQPSMERLSYYRAQIANEITRKKEIGRLSLYYEEIIKRKDGEFDSGVGVE